MSARRGGLTRVFWSRWFLTGCAGLILALLTALCVSLISQSGEAFTSYRFSFVFGNHWDVPAYVFKALPMLVGTLVTAAIAVTLGAPVALACALAGTELGPVRLRAPLALALDLLAAVPSVVYGLWGLLILAPRLLGAERWFARVFAFVPWIGGAPRSVTAENYFITGLILAIMIVPTVAVVSREVLTRVPAGPREAARAAGATRWEVVRTVVLPASRPGLAGAVLLGLGRALGETVAVVLLVGDNPNIGRHLFQGGSTLASVIASELGDAVMLQRAALFGTGLVLFVLTLAVSLLARACLTRTPPEPAAHTPPAPRPADGLTVVPARPGRGVTDRLARAVTLGLALLALVPLGLILLALIRHGLGSMSAGFLGTDPTGSYLGAPGGARSAILGSLEIMVIAAVISVPLGVGVALYLSEYGGAGRFAGAVRTGLAVMAGVPPIVIGLFIYATLVLTGIGGAFSGWKGSLAVALVMVPAIADSADRAFTQLPGGLRTAPLARGAPRRRVIATVVLPGARAGLGAGVLAALARGVGETAPLLFTAAAQNGLTFNPTSQMNSLPVEIYGDVTSTSHALQNQAWACALTLVVIGLILQLAARGLGASPTPEPRAAMMGGDEG